MQEEFLPALFGEAVDDGDCRLEFAHFPVKYSGLALPTTVNSAALNHQASKDVCSHLTIALKDETTSEPVKHTQTMAAAKAAIRTSKDSLPEQEIQYQQYQAHHSQKPRNYQVKDEHCNCTRPTTHLCVSTMSRMSQDRKRLRRGLLLQNRVLLQPDLFGKGRAGWSMRQQ